MKGQLTMFILSNTCVKKLLLVACLAMGTAALSGCDKWIDDLQMEGLLLNNCQQQQPMANVRLRLAQQRVRNLTQPTTDVVAETTTDANGRFDLRFALRDRDPLVLSGTDAQGRGFEIRNNIPYNIEETGMRLIARPTASLTVVLVDQPNSSNRDTLEFTDPATFMRTTILGPFQRQILFQVIDTRGTIDDERAAFDSITIDPRFKLNRRELQRKFVVPVCGSSTVEISL